MVRHGGTTSDTSEAERQPLQNTLEVFRELGGTVVDTAPSYGNAETVVGDLVHELGIRDELFFSTKVRTEGRDEGLAEIDRSFARLQTDTFDLLQVHNLMDTGTQLATLREMKETGRIRYIGITTSSGRQYEEFAAVMRARPWTSSRSTTRWRRAAQRTRSCRSQPTGAWLCSPTCRTGGDGCSAPWATVPCPTGRPSSIAKAGASSSSSNILGHPAVTCVIPGIREAELRGGQHGRGHGGAARRRDEEEDGGVLRQPELSWTGP